MKTPPARVIVFDVNETLLDISALAPLFEQLFGEPRAYREWFSTLLFFSEVLTLAGPYLPFGSLAAAALEMVAGPRGVVISHEDRGLLNRALLQLPPHEDAHDSLARLRDAGLRLAALSNSSPDAVRLQLE